MRRVLVTRPEPGASRTAGRLKAAGCEPVLLPLSKVQAVLVADFDASRFDVIAATSANALIHAPRALIETIADLPCFTVGDRTASEARAAGMENVVAGGGDGTTLAALVIAKTKPRERVLYLCGSVRRDDFESALAVAGRPVFAVETYDTVARAVSAGEAGRVLSSRPVDAVLVYSQQGAKMLLPLLKIPLVAPLFADARILCLSPRIAEVFSGMRVFAAETPDEDALFALLVQES
jgi:uroporphyrinogen-III synthase